MKTNETHNPEPGAATLRIELSESKVTVFNGEGTQLVGPFPVEAGYWDRLCRAAFNLGGQP